MQCDGTKTIQRTPPLKVGAGLARDGGGSFNLYVD